MRNCCHLGLSVRDMPNRDLLCSSPPPVITSSNPLREEEERNNFELAKNCTQKSGGEMGQGRNRKIKGRETIKNKQVLLMNNKNKKEKLFLCGCGLKEGKGLIVFLVSFSEYAN